jgi:CRP-like cAMP-binding protein
LIDRIRHDIQERLGQLLAEVEKLRHALAALDPRERQAVERKPASSRPAAKRPAKTAPTPKPARTRAVSAGSANGSAGSARTARGETRAKVLAALAGDRALTAAGVAEATGLARGTVSTTLSRLAKSGEVVKADRGYRLPASTDAAATGTPEPMVEGS